MGQVASRFVGVAALAVAMASSHPAAADQSAAPIGSAIGEVPIFDAHMHYKEEAWAPFPPATVIELMDRSGVPMALVSSTPDEGTIMLWEYAPARIVPELRPYHGAVGSSNWTKAPGMLAYLEGRLGKYPHRGIGEFHIHRLDPDDEALLREVAALAVRRDILVHIHSGAAPVERLFGFEPGLTILWAHAGMVEPPEVVGPMMDRYPRLYADTSYREHAILGRDGGIDPAWRAVIAAHPDRFLVGTDTWVNEQWSDYQELIAVNRRWLGQFPRDIAEKVADFFVDFASEFKIRIVHRQQNSAKREPSVSGDNDFLDGLDELR